MSTTIVQVMRDGSVLIQGTSATPRLDVRLLIQHVLKCTPEFCITHESDTITDTQYQHIMQLVQSRQRGKPISKIIGHKEFYSHQFKTSIDVLDPRPDSEILIDAVQKYYPDKLRSLDIIELGVGSGCLILTLLNHYAHAHGFGCDISDAALKMTSCNAIAYNLESRLSIMHSHWFDTIEHQFDIIISNPPYIKTADIDYLSIDVKDYDPRIALDGGQDGLDCYRAIAAQVKAHLKPHGHVFLEIGSGQHDDVSRIMQENQLMTLEWLADLSGIKRCGVFKAVDS